MVTLKLLSEGTGPHSVGYLERVVHLFGELLHTHDVSWLYQPLSPLSSSSPPPDLLPHL